MISESFENLEKQISELERKSKRLCKLYKDYLLGVEDKTDEFSCNVALEMIENRVTMIISSRRKICTALEHLTRNISCTKDKLKAIACSTKNGKKRKKINRLFIGNQSVRKQNGKCSFYFKTDSTHCIHENVDIDEIVNDGHRFLSSFKKPAYWTDFDYKIMYNGVHDCVLMDKLIELEEAEDSNADIQTIQNLQMQIKGVRNCEKDYVSDLIDGNFNWKIISRKYLNYRHSPEECERAWRLVVLPIKRNPLQPRELPMLRFLAQQNNRQNWEKINREMSIPRTDYLCFVRFSNNFKLNNKSKTWFEDGKQSGKENSMSFGKLIADVSRKWKLKTHSTNNKKTRCLNKSEKLLAINYLKKGYRLNSICRLLGSRINVVQLRKQLNVWNQIYTRQKWTFTEEKDLLKAVEFVGPGHWTRVSKFLNKSPLQCANKYRRMQKKDGPKSNVEKQQQNLRKKFEDLKRFVHETKKRRSLSFLEQKIKKYFIEYFESSRFKPTYENLQNNSNISDHVLNLFKHLDFNLKISRQGSSALNDFILRKELMDENKLKEFEKQFKKCTTSSSNNVMILSGQNIFSNIISKKCSVLPPNTCTMYGLYNFKRNLKSFATGCPENLEVLWAQLNEKYKSSKNFVEAKILWYRILQAMFYWTLKLETVQPENLLND